MSDIAIAKDGLAQEIFEELEGIWTVDAHEHLPTEEARLKEERDFYSLFQHYCSGDLVAAGASAEDFKVFGDRSLPLKARWERFKPFLSAIRTGGYARSALIVIRDLLEIPDLDDRTYKRVSQRLQEMNRPGLYDRVLRDRCHIAACIECWCLDNTPYPKYFVHLAPGPDLVDLLNQPALDRLGQRCNRSVHSLDDVLSCMTQVVQTWKKTPKVVGIKSAHAYGRSLGFKKRGRSEVESLFNQILTHEGHHLSAHEGLALQDFLLYEMAARAEAVGLPMVFHTGLQAGNFNRIANANPLLLQEFIEEFPRLKIDLFHAGMPWVREIGVLAKYFPNVYLNMAWTHIINPAQARSALSEWLDQVPNTKIFGFGGDYGIVEKVYGHLKIARQNVACVLADKIREGAYTRADASLVAHRLMRENAARFYDLKLD